MSWKQARRAHPLATHVIQLLGDDEEAVRRIVGAEHNPVEWRSLNEAKAAAAFAWRRRIEIIDGIIELAYTDGTVGDILRETVACADIPDPDHVLLRTLANASFCVTDADDDQFAVLLGLAELAVEIVGEAIATKGPK